MLLYSLIIEAGQKEFFKEHNLSLRTLKTEGEWLYGQKIIEKDVSAQLSNVSTPFYHVIRKNLSSSCLQEELKNFPKRCYAIKYKLMRE